MPDGIAAVAAVALDGEEPRAPLEVACNTGKSRRVAMATDPRDFAGIDFGGIEA